MTLKTRLIALVAGALLISLAAGGALITVSASQWVQAEIDTDAQMAQQLVEARIAEEAEETESPDRIIELLHSLEASHHLHAQYLPGNTAPEIRPGVFPPTEGAAPSWLGELLGVRPSVQAIAVSRNGGDRGRIVITTDPGNGISKVWRLGKIGLGAMVLFSASTLGLVALGLTHSLRPLGQLASGLTLIGDGDYSARIGDRGPAEIALLGRHFDLMAEQLQQMRTRTRALTAQLLAAQEHERRDIARDLHDELGPCLLAANLDVLALIRLNLAQKRDAVEDCARGLSSVLNRMQAQVRQMISRLHLESADPFDLGSATADLVGFWRERCPEITWHLAPWEDWPELSRPQAVALLRIVQEAVSNAVRHSGAKHVFIECARDREEIVVRVRDDGKGISASAGTGFGLSGMRERIEALGGTLTITSGPGQGTAVAARLAVPEPGPMQAGAIDQPIPEQAVA